jgi:hypothetical protein
MPPLRRIISRKGRRPFRLWSWKVNKENVLEDGNYGNRSPIFIQILLRHIVFRHFVSLYLALVGI